MKVFHNIFKTASLIVIALLLPQCFSNSGNVELKRESINYLNLAQVNYLKGKMDSNLRYLHTLANIMRGYEDIPAAERRNCYDDMLLNSILFEDDIISVFTVWKPNALDGMDSRYIGRAGSNPSGQYVMEIVKDFEIGIKNYRDIDAVMTYLNNPDSREKYIVDDPAFEIISGSEKLVVKMMVPIINKRTYEVVGVVGCLLNLESIQKEVERFIMEYYEIAVMAVYSNNGVILGHLIPARVGKMLLDADTIYGPYMEDAGQAVLKGQVFYCSSYSPVLNQNVEVFMMPFTLGYSDTTWSVMIAVTESYFKKRSPFSFR